MAVAQQPQTVRLTTTCEGVLTCPQCQKRQQKSLGGYVGVAHHLRVKCGCGAVFPILLELRASYRKQTRLPGTYLKRTSQLSGKIDIVNLSLTGIGFVTTMVHPLHVGDEIMLEFRLDDPQHSVLRKYAVVKHVRGYAVGATFCHLSAYEKELGFYLLNPAVEVEI